MGILFKLEQGLETYSKNDKKIAEYFLHNKEKAALMTTNDLAKATATSTAAIIRFAQKHGYSGISDFKIDLVSDNIKKPKLLYKPITKADSMQDLIDKSFISNNQTITKTYQLIDASSLQKAISILNKADKIYLLGLGDSALACNDFMNKLARIDKRVVKYSEFHIQMASLSYASENDCVVAISSSGETKDIIKACNYAKQAHAKIIAITQFNQNSLSKLADIDLYIPSIELEARLGPISSRLSALIVTDLLYLGIAKNNVDEVKKRLAASDEIIDQFR